jgi:hypothetical protein
VYVVRKGVPAILELWKRLLKGHRAGTLSAADRDLLKKWSKAIAHLRVNPKHPGLNSHEIEPTKVQPPYFPSVLLREQHT